MAEIIKNSLTQEHLKPMGLEAEWLNGGSLRKLDGGDGAYVQFENRKVGPNTWGCSLKMGDEAESLRLDFRLRSLSDRRQIIEVGKVELLNETLSEVTYTADLSKNHHVNRGFADKLFKAFEAYAKEKDPSGFGSAFQAAGLSKTFSVDDAFAEMNSPVFQELDEEPRALIHGNKIVAAVKAQAAPSA